jgi:hypothetical protein
MDQRQEFEMLKKSILQMDADNIGVVDNTTSDDLEDSK